MAGVKGRSGGKRPGAGRKIAEPVFIRSESLLTSDPKQFLTALMNDGEADIKIRADAAKALLAAELRMAEAKGKKSELADAAKKAGAGKFSASAPPKLVAAGGKKL